MEAKLFCSKCGAYDPRSESGCVHEGGWHSLVKDCGVRCAVGLLKTGSLMKQHWGCCQVTDRKSGCPHAKHSLVSGDCVEIVVRANLPDNGDGVYRLNMEQNVFLHECGTLWSIRQDASSGLWWICRGQEKIRGQQQNNKADEGYASLWDLHTWEGRNVHIWRLGGIPTRGWGCGVCLQETSSSSSHGGCFHGQPWHDVIPMCGPQCAVQLASRFKLGAQHWGCCWSVERNSALCSRTSHQSMKDTSVVRYFPASWNHKPYSGHDAAGHALYGGVERIDPHFSSHGASMARLMIGDDPLIVDVDTTTVMDLMLLVQRCKGIPFWRQLYKTTPDLCKLDKSLTLRQAGISHATCFIVYDSCMDTQVTPLPPALNVAIVGGGPVGLWTALSLRLSLNDHIRVTVFEKRDTYQRSHALRIAKMGFDGMVDHDVMRELAARFFPRTRTSVVEQTLKEHSLAHGVVIVNKHVDSLDQLTAEFDLVIAADGARSEARQAMSHGEDEFLVERHLGAGLLQVKFTACGDVSHMDKSLWSQLMNNIELESQLFQVLPASYEKETDTTPVTMFSLILDEAYLHDVSDLSSANAASLEQLYQLIGDGKSSTLCSDVRKIVESIAPNGVVADSVKISVLPAKYHVAKKVHQGHCVILGDAAMGLPLEKGLGYGWRASNFLVQLIRHAGHSFTPQDLCKAFSFFFTELAAEAIASVESDYQAYVKK